MLIISNWLILSNVKQKFFQSYLKKIKYLKKFQMKIPKQRVYFKTDSKIPMNKSIVVT
jgi:hypothetical protein